MIDPFFNTPDTPARLRLEDDLSEARCEVEELRRQLEEEREYRERAGSGLAEGLASYSKQLTEARDALQQLVADIVAIVGRAEKRGDVYTAKEIRAALHKVWPPHYTEGE
jgi:hypothetical protein